MQPSPPNPDNEQSGVQQEISDGSSNHGSMQGAKAGRDSNQISGDGNQIDQSQSTQNFFITLGTHQMLVSLVLTGSFLGGIVFLTQKNLTLPKVETSTLVGNADKCESLPRNPNILRIAIADFDEDGSNSKMETGILKALNAQKLPDVEVCRTEQRVVDDNQAKSRGNKLGAAVVIWGQSDTYRFQVFLKSVNLEIGYLTTLPIDLTNIRDLDLQDQLPQLVTVMVAYHVSESYKSQGKIPKARKTLEDALEVARLKRLNEVDNKYFKQRLSQAHLFLGFLYKGSVENCKGTIEECKKALEEYKLSSNLDEKQYEALFKQGTLQVLLKKPEEAIKVYTKIIESKPEPKIAVKALINRANLYTESSQFEAAIKDFKDVCERQPSQDKYLHFLGIAQIRAGQIIEAKNTYNKLKINLDENKKLKEAIFEDLSSLAQQNPDLTLSINTIETVLR